MICAPTAAPPYFRMTQRRIDIRKIFFCCLPSARCRARGRHVFRLNGRPDQLAHERDHFLWVAILSGEIVERLEARQRVEYSDHLLQVGLATLLRESAE